MHDRRVRGTEFRFGNEGSLWKDAMVWYDWQTDSIWSQPLGTAIAGPETGTQLTLLPFEIVKYSDWVSRHPTTRILRDELRPRYYSPQFETRFFVIGVAIGEGATGYYHSSAADAGFVNGMVGDVPVVLFVDRGTAKIDVFLRTVPEAPGTSSGPRVLEFERSPAGAITDTETASAWNPGTGVATIGALADTELQRVPFVSSFDWAWLQFHPDADLWGDPLADFKTP